MQLNTKYNAVGYVSFIRDKHVCHAKFSNFKWEPNFKWEQEEENKRKLIDSVALATHTCDCTLFPNLHFLFKIFLSIPKSFFPLQRSIKYRGVKIEQSLSSEIRRCSLKHLPKSSKSLFLLSISLILQFHKQLNYFLVH